ncbi:MAG: polysaccharide deacetylase family protein [Firmicutes bacterium]|nr:polysaccharide deacetylase family protein [Bacillota bacterium]
MIFPLAPFHFVILGLLHVAVGLWFVNPWLALVPVGLFPIINFLAALPPGSRYYLPVITRGRPGETGVALTFDDGPDPRLTPHVLDLLDRHGVKATFFVTGAKAQAHPHLVKDLLKRGHARGNHSWSHSPFLMLKGRKALKREVEDTQALLKDLGATPLVFRPPVGITNPHLWRVLLEAGMICVNFSCRAGDMGNRRTQNLAARLLDKVRPRDIVLLHDAMPEKAEAAPLLREFEALLQGLQARNLPVKPLATLLGREVMRSESARAAEIFYDHLAPDYDHEQFCTPVSVARRKEVALFEARLSELFQGRKRVLEIGAGTGIFTLPIARKLAEEGGEVVAVDLSGRMLSLLERKSQEAGLTNLRLRQGAIETMELEGTFDGVCAFSSLEYVTNLPGLLQRLAAQVEPGGIVYFIGARRSLFRFFTQVGNAVRQGLWLRARSRREYETMLKAAGFEPVSISSHLLKCVISGGMLLEVVARKGEVSR